MVKSVIHLTRHAQAQHNANEDCGIPDAPLTPLGVSQARKLDRTTRDAIQSQADLLVTSPLIRTLQTALLGYPHLKQRLESQPDPKPLIVLPQLQEVGDAPCDTGSDRCKLEKIPEFNGIDLSTLEDDWNKKQGIYAPENVLQRAKWVRRWIRDRSEKNIVVVSHGTFLRNLVGVGLDHAWGNAEVRRYTFKSEDDEEAELVFVEQTGGEAPTSNKLAP